MKIYRADAAGNATGDAITTSGNGATSSARQVTVARGERLARDLRKDCKTRR